MKKFIAIVLTFALVFSLAACGNKAKEEKKEEPASATEETEETEAEGEATEGEPIVISIGHTDSSQRSTNVYGEWLNDYLSEKSGGRITVQMYPDGQAGDDPDIAAGVKLGTVTMYFGLASVISSIVGDEASCIDLPYLYPTYEDWITGTFENGGLDLFNETLEGSGYYCVDMLYNGMRNVISNKKIYHNADDLNGQKVRISQNELNVEIWKAMGANPTPMAWGEVITSLSTGAVDALDHSIGVFNDFKIYEMAPYVTVSNHCSSPYPLVCSTEWLESLSDADRELILDGIHQMCEQQRAAERENEMQYLADFEAAGATVYTLTEEETAAFKESVQPVYDMWRERVGDELMDKWLATVPQ